MSQREQYEEYLGGLDLRFIKPREVTNYADRVKNGVKNSLPPEELWENIAAPLWVLDHLRFALDIPVLLTSIYRSPEYNAVCPGASPRSYHKQNLAIDFQLIAPGMPEAERIRASERKLREFRAAGMFRGGIGIYQTFVHVDTRGYNVDW